MPEPYRYAMEQRVIVRHPGGREEQGVVAHRRTIMREDLTLKRYTILYDNDQAEPMIPEGWLKPAEQMELIS